jgi:type I restriction enzyme S subunit
VRFLDHWNGRLEKAIRAKRRVIALLQEQKQAIIHRAVTRGLDPNVKLKDSGISWLGEIPEHWEVRRMKRVGQVKIGLTYSPGEMTDESGMLVLRASNVRNGRIVPADNVYVSKKVPAALLVCEGDILICVRSGSRNLVGKAALITKEFAGVTYGAFMSLLRSDISPFLFWVLNSNLFSCVMAEFETSTINQLTQSDLKNLLVPIPPEEEQSKIVEYLKSATSEVDRAIARYEREITLLREYRTRLTADVVTGNLDVRTAAAQLPDPGEALAEAENFEEEPELEEVEG